MLEPREMNDLIKRAQNQDEEAIKTLYESSKHQAYFIARQFVKHHDVFDILQESYVKAFTHLDQLDQGDNFTKWLHRIIINTSKDKLKKRLPSLFGDLADEKQDIEGEIPEERMEFSPAEALDDKVCHQLLKDIINHLSEEQKTCIILYYYEEYTIKEISELLECSENTVKSRLVYARNNIKKEVLDLEEKGTKLYGFTALPFFLFLLQKESEQKVPLICSWRLSKTIKHISHPVKKLHLGSHQISLRLFVSLLTSTVVIIGAAGAYAYYMMNAFTLNITVNKKLSYEYGDTIKIQDVVDKINDKKFKAKLDDKNSFRLDEKKITLSIKADTKKVGKCKGELIAKYEKETYKTSFTYTVKDTQAPILELSEEAVSIFVGDAFDPNAYIAKAEDIIDGDLKASVKIENPVDIETEGEYTVFYHLEDKHHLKTDKTLVVTVQPKVEFANEAVRALHPQKEYKAGSNTFSASLNPRGTGFATLDARVDSILASITSSGMSHEQRIMAIHDWIATHTTYGGASVNIAELGAFHPTDEKMILQQSIAMDAASVIFHGAGVCNDYAAAFKVIAQRAGYQVIREGGTFTWPDGHATGHQWNRILLNGTWYQVDVQADDYNNKLSHYYFLNATLPASYKGNFAFYQELDNISSLSQLGLPKYTMDELANECVRQYQAKGKEFEFLFIENNALVSFTRENEADLRNRVKAMLPDVDLYIGGGSGYRSNTYMEYLDIPVSRVALSYFE